MTVRFPGRPTTQGPAGPRRPGGDPPSHSFYGPAQAPQDGSSRISSEVRAKLSELTPELAAGVRRVADTGPHD